MTGFPATVVKPHAGILLTAHLKHTVETFLLWPSELSKNVCRSIYDTRDVGEDCNELCRAWPFVSVPSLVMVTCMPSVLRTRHGCLEANATSASKPLTCTGPF